MMAVYSDQLAAGQRGVHTFPGAVLARLVERGILGLPDAGPADEGEPLLFANASRTPLARGALLHRSGRNGERDLTRDTLVVPVAVLAKLPGAVQDALDTMRYGPDRDDATARARAEGR